MLGDPMSDSGQDFGTSLGPQPLTGETRGDMCGDAARRGSLPPDPTAAPAARARDCPWVQGAAMRKDPGEATRREPGEATRREPGEATRSDPVAIGVEMLTCSMHA